MKYGTFLSLLTLLNSARGEAGWTYVGCVEGTEILSQFSLIKFDEPILPEDCTTACENEHYANAALSEGICYCGTKLPTPVPVDEKSCTLPCVLDVGQFCGGSPNDPSSPVALYEYEALPPPSEELVPEPTLKVESISSSDTSTEPEPVSPIAELTSKPQLPTPPEPTYQSATDLTAKLPLPTPPAPTHEPENAFYTIQTGPEYTNIQTSLNSPASLILELLLPGLFPSPTKPTGLAPRMNGAPISPGKRGVNGTLGVAGVTGSTGFATMTGGASGNGESIWQIANALETGYLNSEDRSGFVQFSSANEKARNVRLVGAMWLLAGVLGFMMML